MPTLRRRLSGFTLVELLVVIGIIALLISILLPALNSARQAAVVVKCSSNMRQIGVAFQVYAQANKGKYPVVKYDKAPPPAYAVINGASIYNYYWVDYLAPYLYKSSYPIELFLVVSNTKSKEFENYQKSVLWGCPTWTGTASSNAGWNQNGTSVFDNGYGYNIYPTYESGYPAPGTAVPAKEEAMDSTDNSGNPIGSNAIAGKWYPASRWTHPDQRCLVVENNLWLLGLNPTDPTTPVIQDEDSAILSRVFPGTKGWTNVARYRHGKYPKVSADGKTYASGQGGKVRYNMLYADGHVATLQDIKDAFKAIRMRYPG